jgi:hypothetical protein
MINAMGEALEVEAIGTTSLEVMSAAMSLCLRVVKAGISMGADPNGARRGIERILVECVDPKAKAN